MSEQIIDQVQSKYAALAATGLSSNHVGVRAVAEAFGYSPEELASIPAEAPTWGCRAATPRRRPTFAPAKR